MVAGVLALLMSSVPKPKAWQAPPYLMTRARNTVTLSRLNGKRAKREKPCAGETLTAAEDLSGGINVYYVGDAVGLERLFIRLWPISTV